MRLEPLEDRLAPAFTLTLNDSGLTSGVTRTATATTATYEATAAGATLNWLDIAADLQLNLNVVVTSGTTGAEAGNITDTLVGGISIGTATAASLTFQSGTGTNLVGNISLGDIRLGAPGSSIVVSAANNVSVGTLDSTLGGPLASVQLTTTGGAVSGGTVVATDLAISTFSGIGTMATPFQTTVVNLAARNTTDVGGIYITETDDLRLTTLSGIVGVQAPGNPLEQIRLRTVNGDLDTNGSTILGGGGAILLTAGGLDHTFLNTTGLVQTNQTIHITADRMQLGTLANRLITTDGTVGFFPFTASRPIDLGSTADPTGSLNLSNAELNTVSTSSGVTVGGGVGGVVTVSDTITLSFRELILQTVAGLSGSGDIINGTAGELALSVFQGGNSTYSGAIGGPSSGTAAEKNIRFRKFGDGTLTLSGANTYTGTTEVSQGTLLVNGTSGTGATTVRSFTVSIIGTIGGTGTIGGSLTVFSGGVLSPGDGGVGTLTVAGDLTLNNGSTLFVEVGPGAAADRVVVTGNVTVNNGAKLLGAVTSPAAGGYELIDVGGTSSVPGTGFVDVNNVNLTPPSGGPINVGGRAFSYSYAAGDGNDFALTALIPNVFLDGSGNLIVTDLSNRNDTLTVSRNGANVRVHDPNNQLVAGVGVTQIDANTVELPFANITGAIQISTGGGDDGLTIDYSGGDPLPAGGLRYDGGAGDNDALSIKGSGTQTATYTPSATTHGDGTVVVDGKTIDFVGLEPMDMSGMLLAVVNLPGGDDVVDVANGFDSATGLIPALVVSGTSGGVAFESAHLWNNTTVQINTAGIDGSDTVTITSAFNAHNNTNLLINTGTNSDTLTVAGGVVAAGDIKFFSTTITVNGSITSTAGGDIALSALDSGAAGDTLTLNNDVNAVGGIGTITLFSDENIVQNADVFAGGAADIAAVAATGTLTMSATATTFSNGGDIVYQAGAGLAAGLFTTTGGVGLASLNGAITDANATNNVAAASLVVVAGAGGIGAGDALETAVAQLAASGQGDVKIINTGALDVTTVSVIATTSEFVAALSFAGIVSSTAGVTLAADSLNLIEAITAATTVTLTATTGGITRAGAGPDVIADGLAMSAVTGIGVGGAIQTEVDRLEAQTATGGIVVTNATGDLTVGGVDPGLSGVQVATSGDIEISAAGSIFVTVGGDTVQGPAAVTLTATDDITTGGDNGFDGLTTFGAIASTGGLTTLDAGRDVIIGDAGAGLFGDVTGFGVALNAGRDVIVTQDSGVIARGAGTLTVQATGDVRLQPPAGIFGPGLVTEGGDISITAGGDFVAEGGTPEFSGVDSQTNGAPGGDIVIVAANIVLGDSIAAGLGTVTLVATVGSITDTTPGNNRIFAAGLAMTAVSGIGVGGAIETEVANLEAETATGGIFVTNTGDLTIGDVTAALSGVQVTGAGDILLDSDASLFVTVGDDTVQGPEAVTLTATDDITTGGDNGFGLTTFGAIASTGGLTTLDAGRDVIIGDAGAGLFGDVTGFGVALNAGRDVIVTQDSSAIARGAGTLTVQATGDVRLQPPGAVFGPGLVTEGGDISITAGGDFVAEGGTFFSGVDSQTNGAPGGDIVITAANIVLGDSIAAGLGTVTLVATVGSITDPSPISNRIFAAAVVATAVTGIQLQTQIGTLTATVSGAGGIVIDEFEEAVFGPLDGLTVASAVTADGPVSITANGDILVQSIVSATDAPANAVVVVATSGNVTVETITAGASTDATLVASAGSIFDDGNNATLITVGSLFLTADRAIGAPGATAQIDTAVTQVEADTLGAGPFAGVPVPGIWIGDVDDLIVNDTSTGDGFIVIDAGGDLDARSVTAGGTGRNVRLWALGGDLIVGVVTAADDIAFLAASGAITDGNAAGADVTAAQLAISAGAGIGAGDSLDTVVSTLAWSSGTGGIALDNTGDLTVNDVIAFGAAVFGGSGMGSATVSSTLSLTIATVVAMGTDITFTAGEVADFPTCDNDLTVNAGVLVQTAAGSITLRAGDDVVITAGSNVQAGAAITILAAFADLDLCGTAVLDGTLVAGTNIAVCVNDDLALGGGIFATNGTVSLRSLNGQILDTNGTDDTNIFALGLAMRASTGIGVGDAIDLGVDRVEAETLTGGIFLASIDLNSEFVDLAIGGVTPDACVGDLNGVQVLTGGDIRVESLGLLIDTAGDIVAGPGNITLLAHGTLTVQQNVTSTAAADGAVITLTGEGGVTVENGATVANSNGLAVTIDVDGTGSAGHVEGVVIAGATLDAGAGTITIDGTGFAGVNNAFGVAVLAGAVIKATDAGTVTITGFGGSGTDFNAGVILPEAGTDVSTVDGALTITGVGDGTGAVNIGVLVQNGAAVRSLGTGSVTVTGSGGGGTGDDNVGVNLDGAGTMISSAGGTVHLTGSGGGSGASGLNYGVAVLGGAVVSAATTVQVTGAGGAGDGNFNLGVHVSGAGSAITSAGGPVVVTGTGGGAGVSNFNAGVVVRDGGAISGTGSAVVAVTGIGGNGDSEGVRVDTAGASISTVDGALIVTGTSVTAGATAFGIDIFDTGVIRSTGAGAVTLTGSSVDPDTTAGIRLLIGGSIQANTGDLTLNAEEMDFEAGTSVTGNANLFLLPQTTARGISLGAAANLAGKLSLTATDVAAIGSTFTLITIGRVDTTGAATVDGNATFGADVLLQTPGAGSSGISAAATLSVGANDLILVSGSNIVTTGAGLFEADTLAMFAITGIGAPGAPGETMVNNVEAITSTGGVYIHNAGALTIGGARPGLTGIDVATSGDIEVTADGSLTVVENVSTAVDDILLVASDSAAVGDDIDVQAGAQITTGGGNITLQAGDDLAIAATATLQTSGAGIILLEVDANTADPGVGGVATFSGASLDAPAGATVLGNGDNDTFNFSPSPTTPITVNGAVPVTLPGDTLNFDLTGTVGETLQITDTFTAMAGFTTALDVNIISIESVNAVGGNFNVLLDLAAAALNGTPFGNGSASPDAVQVSLNAAGTQLLFGAAQNGGALINYFGVGLSATRGLSLAGSGDRTAFSLAESAGGLPTFAGTAGGSHDTAGSLPAGTFTVPNVGLNLEGGTSGADTLALVLATNRAISYFADLTGGRGGTVEAANTMRLSFENLALLSIDGNNGTFLADATLVNSNAFTLADDATPSDGMSLLAGSGGFTNTEFGGFNEITVRGGTGTQHMSLNALDALDAALLGLTISGDNAFGNDPAADVLLVHSLLAGRSLILVGGAGDDVFQTVPGLVTAVGDAGANRLVINASAIAAAQNLTMTSHHVNGGGTFNVFYQSIGGNFANGILLITGNGADNITVNSTPGPTGLATGGGNDTVTVTGTAALRTLLATTLTLDAGEGTNTLNVNDSSNAVGGNFDVSRLFLAGIGWRVDYGATDGSIGLLSFVAGTGNDLVRVLSLGAARTVVNAFGGNDVIRVFIGNNNLPVGLELNGGLGTNNRLQTFDLTGGALIRNFPTGPRSGLIQDSYQANTPVTHPYVNIDQVLGINPTANYVTALFRHILGRNPTGPAEVNNWINALNVQGRPPVVNGLEVSTEGRTFLVRKWFLMFFGRTPLPGESAPLVNALVSGQTEEQVLGTLLGSPALPLTAAFRTQMVNAFYQDLLRRAPTAEELATAVNGGQPLQTIRGLIEIGQAFFLVGV